MVCPADKPKFFSPCRVMAALFGAVLVCGIALAVKRYRHHFFAEDFYIVEPGAIYRGARQTPRMLRKIASRYGFRTIVNLDDRVLDPGELGESGVDPSGAEKDITREMGIQYHGFLWKGSGVGPYDQYDKVAGILATTSCRPLFIHCAAGEKRTNAGLGAYLIRYRGYTFDQAVKALVPYGLEPDEDDEFMEHLRGYYKYCQDTPLSASSTSTVSAEHNKRSK